MPCHPLLRDVYAKPHVMTIYASGPRQRAPLSSGRSRSEPALAMRRAAEAIGYRETDAFLGWHSHDEDIQVLFVG